MRSYSYRRSGKLEGSLNRVPNIIWATYTLTKELGDVVSARSDAQVDLDWVRICLICGGEMEDAGGIDEGPVGGDTLVNYGAVSCTNMIFTHPMAPEGRSALGRRGERGCWLLGWPSSRLIRRIVNERFFQKYMGVLYYDQSHW